MGWQTTLNSVDCGIFVMRHMETYMGNLCAGKVGLRIEKVHLTYLLLLLKWYCIFIKLLDLKLCAVV